MAYVCAHSISIRRRGRPQGGRRARGEKPGGARFAQCRPRTGSRRRASARLAKLLDAGHTPAPVFSPLDAESSPSLPSQAQRHSHQPRGASQRPLAAHTRDASVTWAHATFVYSLSEFKYPGALYKLQQASHLARPSPSSSPPLSSASTPLRTPRTSTNGTHILNVAYSYHVLTSIRSLERERRTHLYSAILAFFTNVHATVASPLLARLVVRLASPSRAQPRPVSSSPSAVSTVC